MSRAVRKNISSGAPWESIVGYSRAVRVGNHVWISGTTATDESGKVVGAGDAAAQTRYALQKIDKALQRAGLSLSNVVRTRMFVTDISQWEAIGRVHGEFFGTIRPAATMVEVSKLIDPAHLIEIEVDFWTDYDERPLRWITSLQAAGIRVGILSNLPRVLAENLRAKRFVNHFDHVTFSFELLTVKPQAAIYRHAIEGLGVTPQEALFIDDKLPNVHGAIAVGLHAELFTTWEDFLERDVPGLYGLIQSP